jgi:MFS superfamily sulfate permease-like transporter
MIPNAALAAMLIAVGIKLAHPSEFRHMLVLGKDQFLIFVVTIVVTLLEDLLLGIAAGIIVKIVLHLLNGAGAKELFSNPAKLSHQDGNFFLEIEKPAVFTNLLKIRKVLKEVPKSANLQINMKNSKLVDHTVMVNIEAMKEDFERAGGKLTIIGLENHKGISDHKLSTKKINLESRTT